MAFFSHRCYWVVAALCTPWLSICSKGGRKTIIDSRGQTDMLKLQSDQNETVLAADIQAGTMPIREHIIDHEMRIVLEDETGAGGSHQNSSSLVETYEHLNVVSPDFNSSAGVSPSMESVLKFSVPATYLIPRNGTIIMSTLGLVRWDRRMMLGMGFISVLCLIFLIRMSWNRLVDKDKGCGSDVDAMGLACGIQGCGSDVDVSAGAASSSSDPLPKASRKGSSPYRVPGYTYPDPLFSEDSDSEQDASEEDDTSDMAEPEPGAVKGGKYAAEDTDASTGGADDKQKNGEFAFNNDMAM